MIKHGDYPPLLFERDERDFEGSDVCSFDRGAGEQVPTAFACELRRRSGTLLAAAALHWATNGLGLLIAAALATVSLA
jgi:hypothetical protein